MINKPQYIIVAGINGAGKSTLYDTLPILFDKTKRINADEILRKMGGDWHKDSDNLKAMREEIKQLHYSLDNRQSIHVETTLAGRGKAQLNLIDKAHENGFEVTLLYVALRDENLAIKRVKERVQKGGHGVPAETIKKRYRQSNHNLPEVAFKVDKVMIYDNSEKFTPVYVREKEQIIKNNLSHFPWINQNITCSENVQKQLQNFADQNPEVKPKNDPENKNDRPSY
ncbi:zeta toxin family protein [Oenococcus oeni]